MCQNKIRRYEQVEFQVNSGAPTKVMFQDLPNLRNQPGNRIIIKDIEVTPVTVMPTSPNGVAVSPLTELKKAVLVLYVQGEESVNRVPLLKLVRTDDGGTTPFQQKWESFADLQNVDWAKSYVLFSSAPAGTPYVILFGVEYEKLSA